MTKRLRLYQRHGASPGFGWTSRPGHFCRREEVSGQHAFPPTLRPSTARGCLQQVWNKTTAAGELWPTPSYFKGTSIYIVIRTPRRYHIRCIYGECPAQGGERSARATCLSVQREKNAPELPPSLRQGTKPPPRSSSPHTRQTPQNTSRSLRLGECMHSRLRPFTTFLYYKNFFPCLLSSHQLPLPPWRPCLPFLTAASPAGAKTSWPSCCVTVLVLLPPPPCSSSL